jgi:hypothetical protein
MGAMVQDSGLQGGLLVCIGRKLLPVLCQSAQLWAVFDALAKTLGYLHSIQVMTENPYEANLFYVDARNLMTGNVSKH